MRCRKLAVLGGDEFLVFFRFLPSAKSGSPQNVVCRESDLQFVRYEFNIEGSIGCGRLRCPIESFVEGRCTIWVAFRTRGVSHQNQEDSVLRANSQTLRSRPTRPDPMRCITNWYRCLHVLCSKDSQWPIIPGLLHQQNRTGPQSRQNV